VASHKVTERVYEQRPDGRTVLAAVPGDEISAERAKELGLVGKGERVQLEADVDDPYLREGLEPLDTPEAHARATGDTAEAAARRAAARKK